MDKTPDNSPTRDEDDFFPIRTKANTTDIEVLAPEVTDEEFDHEIVAILQDTLHETEWNDKLTSSRNFKRLPGIAHIPLICKADECEFAAVCPIMRELKGDPHELEKKEALRGTDCRVDRIESARIFSQWVRELQIKPGDTTDLLHVTSLVRLFILQRRVDWQLQMCGIMVDAVGGIMQKSERVIYQKVPNGLLKETKTIQDQINTLISQLNASRQDKIKSKDGGDNFKLLLERLERGRNKTINTYVKEDNDLEDDTE